jgi:hypothetical protein
MIIVKFISCSHNSLFSKKYLSKYILDIKKRRTSHEPQNIYIYIYYSKIETIFILTIHRCKRISTRFIDDILNMIANMDQFLISIE